MGNINVGNYIIMHTPHSFLTLLHKRKPNINCAEFALKPYSALVMSRERIYENIAVLMNGLREKARQDSNRLQFGCT